jgi:hypothetical protein
MFNLKIDISHRKLMMFCSSFLLTVIVRSTGTCFIQKIYAPPLPYFKVNICPLPLPHFASIFFAYLWSFRWPNYKCISLHLYFSFRLPHLNINTGPLRRIGQEYSASRIFYFSVTETDTTTSGLRWIFSYAFGIL